MANNIIIEVNGVNKAKASSWRDARRKLVGITKDMDAATATLFDPDRGYIRGYLHKKSVGTVFTGGTHTPDAPIAVSDAVTVLNGYVTANDNIDRTISEMVRRELPMLVQEIQTDEYICPACCAEISHCSDGIVTDMFCPICGQRLEVLPRNN